MTHQLQYICYRCISADVPDSLVIGSGTYKMCTVQPASSPPKTDLTKGIFIYKITRSNI
jgi:hypothetical protein